MKKPGRPLTAEERRQLRSAQTRQGTKFTHGGLLKRQPARPITLRKFDEVTKS